MNSLAPSSVSPIATAYLHPYCLRVKSRLDKSTFDNYLASLISNWIIVWLLRLILRLRELTFFYFEKNRFLVMSFRTGCNADNFSDISRSNVSIF